MDIIVLCVILGFVVGVFIQNMYTQSAIRELKRSVSYFRELYDLKCQNYDYQYSRIIDRLNILTRPVNDQFTDAIKRAWEEVTKKENENED